MCRRVFNKAVVLLRLAGYEMILLYLPTQIRFLIGGERVTCHWSKLHDAVGRTKLHDVIRFSNRILPRKIKSEKNNT